MPPRLSGTSFIVENLSRQFSPQEMVLAGQAWQVADEYQRDPHLPAIHYLDKEWTWPRRGQSYIRWARWLTLPALARRVERLARTERCDAILGIFPNEFFLYAAFAAARRLCIPFYPYFHNTYRENRRGLPLRFANWFERHVCKTAPLVFVVSAGMQQYYQARYPGVRFETLLHPFNEPLPEFTPPPLPRASLSLALLGTLNESNADAARRLAKIVNRREDCRLTTYSGTDDWYFAKTGVCGPRITHSRVAYDEVTATLQSHDILLLPHGLSGGWSDAEYATIFPTRTISYLLAGRPILAHTRSDCFLTRWLREHDCAEIVDRADERALSDALDRLRDDTPRREQLVRNACAAAREFHAPVVAAKLREIVTSSGKRPEGQTR
jgi:glycosyltransferase involved in cell wall biosynthesis